MILKSRRQRVLETINVRNAYTNSWEKRWYENRKVTVELPEYPSIR